MRRFALAAAVLVFLPGVRAHADTMLRFDAPEMPSMSSIDPSAAEGTEGAPAALQLPAVEGSTTLALGAQNNAVTPEPAGFLLMGTGLLCMGGLTLRRRVVARSAAPVPAR